MKKNSRISKMLGIGFLSMTTIFGGAFISMHDVFAAGGDGKDGDTHGTSQGTTDSSSDSVSISSYLQALYLDNESDEDDISRVGVDQYLDDSGYMNYDALDFNDTLFGDFDNDFYSGLSFDVEDNPNNSTEGQNPAPLPSAPSSTISPQDTNLSVNTRKTNQITRNLAKHAVIHRPGAPLTENALRVKNAIYWFGVDHGFINPTRRVLKIGRNCAKNVPLRKGFAQKIVKTAVERILLMRSPSRDEIRAASLMYNNVANRHFNEFMRLMSDPDFEARCVNVCKNDQVLLNTLGVTPNDIH